MAPPASGSSTATVRSEVSASHRHEWVWASMPPTARVWEQSWARPSRYSSCGGSGPGRRSSGTACRPSPARSPAGCSCRPQPRRRTALGRERRPCLRSPRIRHVQQARASLAYRTPLLLCARRASLPSPGCSIQAPSLRLQFAKPGGGSFQFWVLPAFASVQQPFVLSVAAGRCLGSSAGVKYTAGKTRRNTLAAGRSARFSHAEG